MSQTCQDESGAAGTEVPGVPLVTGGADLRSSPEQHAGRSVRSRTEHSAVRGVPDRALLLGLGLLALLLRLIALAQFRASDAFGLLLGDASTYDPWARAIASGDWFGHGVFYQAPLYPYLLGVIYAVAGHSLTAVRLVQALLGSGACVALALAGRSFFNRRAGMIAGVALALYPPAIFYDGLLEKTCLTGFLFAALLAALGRMTERPGRAIGAASGALLGLLAVTRENALILAPVLLACVLWFPGVGSARQRRDGALALALGLGVILAPVALRNAIAGGEFHLTTAQFGPNFYIGNGPQADGTYVPLVVGHGDPAYERADATHLAEQALGRALTPGQVSSYWTRQTLRAIASHPGRWIGLLARKSAMAVNAVEVMDTEDIYTHAQWTHILRWLLPLLHFGIVLPLAVAGILFSVARRRRLIPLYAVMAAYGLGVILMFVLGRYRYPLALPAILFAGAAVDEAWRSRLRSLGRRRLALTAIAVVLVAVGANWPLIDRSGYRPVTECNIAYALMSQGAPDQRALAHVDAALRAQPRFPNAHHLRGVLLAEAGPAAEAEKELRRAIELEPDRALTYGHLAGLLASQGRLSEAIPLLERSLALDPFDAEAQNNLAGMLAEVGRCAEAVERIRHALGLRPDDAELRVNCALILATCGRTGDAEAWIESWGPRSPLAITARQRLAAVFLQRNLPHRAIEELERALASEPQALGPRAQLAWILATHADPTVRDGARALGLARGIAGAPGAASDAQALDLLAAALAEAGDFEGARRTAGQAQAEAQRAGQGGLVEAIARRLEFYRQGRSYREGSW